jgi:hypothetical protein
MMDPIDDPILPERLRDDLGALYRAEVQVPADVDRLVLSSARARSMRRGRWARWVGAGAAVAAVVVVSITLLRPHASAPQQHARRDVYTPDGDADGNAVVDIRDALALARNVEAGNAKWTRWEDVNRDKVIDRKDVDAIAMMAVALKPEVVR